MKPETLLLMQAIGATMQSINAGLATVVHNPVVSLVIASIVGGYQFYVQHVGNLSQPKAKKAKKAAPGA